MKKYLKSDIRVLLPGFVMLFMAAIALFLIMLFGIFLGNGDFTITSLYICFIAFIFACFYVMISNANLFRKNLGDEEYLEKVGNDKLSFVSWTIRKMVTTYIQLIAFLVIYGIVFVLGSVVARKRFPDEAGEKGTSFIKQVFSVSNNPSAVQILLGIITVLLVLAAVSVMVYLAFTLVYFFFIRGNYSFIASLMTLFSIFWLSYKLLDFIVPESGTAALVGTGAYALVGLILMCSIELLIINKKLK